jgi:hypothetical protein
MLGYTPELWHDECPAAMSMPDSGVGDVCPCRNLNAETSAISITWHTKLE